MNKNNGFKRAGCGFRLTLLAMLASFSFFVAPGFGAPMNGLEFEFTQPDGTTITVRFYGDEFYARAETPDGYTVIFDPATKTYLYANLSPDGNEFVSTGKQVGRDNPDAGLPKRLEINRASRAEKVRKNVEAHEAVVGQQKRWEAVKAANRNYRAFKEEVKRQEKAGKKGFVIPLGTVFPDSEIPPAPEMSAPAEGDGTVTEEPPIAPAPPSFTLSGDVVGLTILVDFSDVPGTVVTQAQIDDYCNKPNYTNFSNAGSIYDYFFIQSGGNLRYNNNVTYYVRVPQPKTYYNVTTSDSGVCGRLLLNDALNVLIADGYDFSQLTTKSGGNVRACNVYFSGANSGVWSKGLWPHRWVLSSPKSVGGGKYIYDYQVTNIGTTPSLTIGTFCHENGHMLLGYPDLYSYDGNAANIGAFSLMASSGSTHPVNIDPYLKEASGWMDIIDINSNSQQRCTVQVDGNQIYRYLNPAKATEYFLFEVRDNTGYEGPYGGASGSVNPSAGLVVYHVLEAGSNPSSSIWTVSNPAAMYTKPYELLLVEANQAAINPWYDDPTPDASDAFKASGKSHISGITTPELKFWASNGRTVASGCVITNISADSSNMTFIIGGPLPPTSSIVLSRSTIDSYCNYGTTATPASFTIGNGGGGTLNYTITDDQGWLACSPTSGTASNESDSISVSFVTTNLAAGSYSATITVTDPAASPTTDTITVGLTVTPQPIFAISATNIVENGIAGAAGPQVSFTIDNTGGGTLPYSLSKTQSWLTLSATSGTVVAETDTIYVNLNSAVLASGTYNDTITITSPTASNSPRTIPVTFLVNGDDIIVSAPNGGEEFLTEYPMNIAWSSGIGGNVSVELLKSGSLDTTIEASTPNDGSYVWPIPLSKTGTVFRIRITSLDANPGFADDSNSDFAIIRPPIYRWWDGGAVNITTNGNGGSAGGSGIWNTSIENWDQGNGQVHVAWNDANTNIAVFGGTGATVTNQGATVGGMIFTAAYTITSGTVTFAESGSISNSAAVTISSQLAGTGPITKDGAGTLTLPVTNTYTGGTVVRGGVLSGLKAGSLGDGTITIAGSSTLTAGSTVYPVFANELSVNSGVVLTNGGGDQNYSIGVDGVVSGAGTIVYGTGNNGNKGYSFAMLNHSNTFTGTLRVNNACTAGIMVKSLPDSTNRIVLNNSRFIFSTNSPAPLTFNNRRIELAGTTSGGMLLNNNTNPACPLTINTDLLVSGIGNKTQILESVAGPVNVFGGRIADGPSNSVISVSKSGAGIWALAGSNTYSGATIPAAGTLIVQGRQALPAVSPITFSAGSTLKLLDDGSGTVTLGNPVQNPNQNANATIFVGNNGTTNGGSNPGSTTLGSTIALGDYNFNTNSAVNNRILYVTGTNDYRLQLSNVNLNFQGCAALDTSYRTCGNISPSTAPLTITGTVIQPDGKPALNDTMRFYREYLTLDGTASNNWVSGTIKDSADYTSGSNTNASPLNLHKRSAGSWNLSGTNLYSGQIVIAGGTLVVNRLANGGFSSPLGKSSSDPANLVLAGGALKYAPINGVGAAGHSTDRNFAMLGNSTIDASGTGPLVFVQTGVVSPDIIGLDGAWATTQRVVTALSSTANLTAGMRVSGTGITAGTLISSIDGPTQLTLSANTTSAGSGNIVFGYPARTLTLTGDSTNANTIAGSLQNSIVTGTNLLTLTKTGTGTWILAGTNSFTGATTVSGGSLYLDGQFPASGTMAVNTGATLVVNGLMSTGGTVAVNSGATMYINGQMPAGGTITVGSGGFLGGTGTLGRVVTVNNGGFLSPGATVGTLTSTTNMTIQSGAKLAINIDDAQTPACGKLAVARTLTITGSTLNILTNGIPDQAVYVIATYLTRTGTFTATNGLPANYVLDYAYNTNTAIALIKKSIPTITNWPSASGPINYGQAVSNAVLTGGSASVPGTFSYNTPTQVPNAGTNAIPVTFKPTDTNIYNNAVGTVDVVVNKALASVTLGALAQTYNGAARAVTVTTAPTGLVCSVTYNGVAAAPTNAGSYAVVATITATNHYGSTNRTLVVSQAAASVTEWPTAASITVGQALSEATLTGGSASVAGGFSYNSPGTTPSNGTYAAAVTFTPTDSLNYLSVTGTVNVMVALSAPTVSVWPTASSITYGQAASNATLSGGSASVSGGFIYNAPSAILPAGTNAVAVTFVPADTNSYSSVGGSVSVTVARAVPTVTAWPVAASVTLGQAVSNATLSGGTASTAGSFTYDSPAYTPSQGVYVAAVTFSPVDTANFLTATGTVNIAVGLLLPTVTTWPTATAITYGQALSAATLSGGSASVPGSFGYDFPATVPNAGTNAAAVRFIPTDTTNYQSVAGSVTVAVSKASSPVTLGNLAQTYDGTARVVTADTLPAGLTVGLTYAGSPSAPTNAGSYAVVATINESNYLGGTNGMLVVAKATPTVTAWPTAPAIIAGQAISNAPLSGGTASVAGSFAYAAPTTVPSLGVYAASVTFTPSDTVNYTTVAGTVNVPVVEQVPAVPTGLAATPTVGRIDLSWAAASRAAGYNVKRASVPGGPYTTIGTPAATNYSDTAVASAMTYYYVVSATNTGGESANSTQVSVFLPQALPFAEDFEALTPGNLAGQNGWNASDAVVQANVAIGSQAAQITSDAGYAGQAFTGSETNVWTDFSIQPVLFDGNFTPPVDATAMIYFNTNGNPVVYNGTNAMTLASVQITPGEWVRVTIHGDYVAKTWDLYIDVALVASDLVFYNASVTEYDSLRINGGAASSGFLDEVRIDTVSPLAGLLIPDPSGLIATPISSWAVDLGWTDNSTNETGFALQRSATSGAGFVMIGEVDADVATYADSTVAPGQTYYYRVIGTNAMVSSAPSGEAVVTTPKAEATVTLDNLEQSYSGAARMVSVTTSPTGLAYSVTYDGGPAAPTNAGSYAVVATVNDAAYAGSASNTLVVARATPTVTAWPSANPITYGQAVSNATLSGGSASVAGSFIYDAPAVVPDAGTYTADVTFTPTDTANYESVAATVGITVDKATPTILVWPVAAAITHGQAVSNAILSGGSASVAGSFGYDAPSTVPVAGTYTADVTFTPSDTVNYEWVAGTVSVTVVPVEYTLIYIAGTNGTLFGDASQTVVHGSNGTEVIAIPNTGYTFVNWSDARTDNPRTDVNVTNDLTVTASFTMMSHTFSVVSAYGSPNPAGVTTHAWNTVLSPVMENATILNTTTQYMAKGWIGTGSLTNGTGTNTTFTLTNDTTMTWLWKTNYWIRLDVLTE